MLIMIKFPVRKLASMRLAALLFCSLGCGQILSADSYTYTVTTFDGLGGSGSTYLIGINDSGQIIGTSNGQGFLYSNGVFSTLPGNPSAISDNGTVVGNIPNPQTSPITSFVYSNGNYSTVTAPNQGYYTTAGFTGVNDAGVIIGGYSPGPYAYQYDNGSGFIYSNSAFQAEPGGISKINDSGTIIGFNRPSLFSSGFIIDANNNFTQVSYPTPAIHDEQTVLYGINNSGQILGSFSYSTTSLQAFSGYFIYTSGVFTNLNLPSGYQPLAINDAGQLVGDVLKAGGLSDGFIATPVPQVPEIDVNSGASAVALLAGLLLIVQRRQVRT